MNRQEAEELFQDFLDNSLDEKTKDQLIEHFEECGQTKRAFEEYRAVVALEQKLAAEEHTLDAAFSIQVMDAIEKRENASAWLQLPTFLQALNFQTLSFGSLRRYLVPAATIATASVALVITFSNKDNLGDYCLNCEEVISEQAASTTKIDQTGNNGQNPTAASVSGQVESKLLGQSIRERDADGPKLLEPLASGKKQKTKAANEKINAKPDAQVPPGFRAVTIPVDKRSGVEGFAQPGSRVDVQMSYKSKDGKKRIANISRFNKVLSVGEQQRQELRGGRDFADRNQAAKGNKSAVTLLVPKKEAKKMELAQQVGALSLSLNADQEERARELSAPQSIQVNDLIAAKPKAYKIIPPRRVPQSGEVYGQYEEHRRTKVSVQPRSTFSIDVDTGSYTNARRFLSMGQLPPASAIRVEEFINYFDYDYPSGSDKPFAANYEIAPSPFEPERLLLKLGIKARDAALGDSEGWNLVFLIDVSGSMRANNKLPLLKRSMEMLANRMRPQDRVAIVTYSNRASTVLYSTAGSNKAMIISAIQQLRAGGGTNGGAGIEEAYRIAEQNMIRSGTNRVVLATDGDFNVGTTNFNSLMSLIEQKRRSGITLTTLGFGVGNYNEKNLEQLANRGNGNYFYIDQFKEARRVFEKQLAGSMEVVAKDVKLQIEFNPDAVEEYRLIGYDNRKLANRDFNNDSVDAGEIGAGHTVTALYEVVLKNGSSESTKFANEMAFLKIRYKEPQAETSKLLEFPLLRSNIKTGVSQASNDFRFAAAVAYFGQILRKSRYLGSYNIEDTIRLAEQAVGNDKSGKRKEFLELMRNVKPVVIPAPVEPLRYKR